MKSTSAARGVPQVQTDRFSRGFGGVKRQQKRDRLKNIDQTIARWHGITEALPYRRAEGVLTKGERAFWIPLVHAINGNYGIFCKVRLADVVPCPPERPDEPDWFDKIARYHVDFVLYRHETTYPLLVIELDDRSHRDSSRLREFDEWKDAVLRAAGLPIYRVPVQPAYDVLELAQTIDQIIGGNRQ